jgi:hypothetical protein
MIYSVFEEWPDQSWEKEAEINLFSRKAYWDLQMNELVNVKDITPILLKNQKDEIVAFWCFALTKKTWITPLNAPYFEPFIGKNGNLNEILSIIIQHLKHKQNVLIEWTLPPNWTLLGNNNFDEVLKMTRISSIAMGHKLLVIASKSFSEIIKQERKKRKLQSFLVANYKIEEASSDKWDNLYKQLLSWRKQKEHRNMMSKELMLKSKELFPQLYRCLQLTLNEQIAGLAFFMQTNSDCFYIYSLITDPKLNRQQPSLLLWNALYNLAQAENIHQLDLGTSMTSANQLNKGLFRFKLSLGAQPTKKFTLLC